MDRNLSLKAKGLLSVVLSLPDDWEYSVAGLASMSKEKESAITSALKELKEEGYLVVTKKMPNVTKSGRIEYEWDFFEEPHIHRREPLPIYDEQETKKQGIENQGLENLTLEVQGLENQAQLNTNISITKEENTKELSTDILVVGKPQKTTRFTPPTVEEVTDYCHERNNHVDPEKFVDYYQARGWKIGKNSMKDWRAAVRTWERNDYSEKSRPAPVSSNPFTELKRKEGWL
jgi:hypothetical protein